MSEPWRCGKYQAQGEAGPRERSHVLWAARADKPRSPKLIGAQMMPPQVPYARHGDARIGVSPAGFHCGFGPVSPCCPPPFLSLVMRVFSLCCDTLEVCRSFSYMTGAHSLETEPSLRSDMGRRVLKCVCCVKCSTDSQASCTRAAGDMSTEPRLQGSRVPGCGVGLRTCSSNTLSCGAHTGPGTTPARSLCIFKPDTPRSLS